MNFANQIMKRKTCHPFHVEMSWCPLVVNHVTIIASRCFGVLFLGPVEFSFRPLIPWVTTVFSRWLLHGSITTGNNGCFGSGLWGYFSDLCLLFCRHLCLGFLFESLLMVAAWQWDLVLASLWTGNPDIILAGGSLYRTPHLAGRSLGDNNEELTSAEGLWFPSDNTVLTNPPLFLLWMISSRWPNENHLVEKKGKKFYSDLLLAHWKWQYFVWWRRRAVLLFFISADIDFLWRHKGGKPATFLVGGRSRCWDFFLWGATDNSTHCIFIPRPTPQSYCILLICQSRHNHLMFCTSCHFSHHYKISWGAQAR